MIFFLSSYLSNSKSKSDTKGTFFTFSNVKSGYLFPCSKLKKFTFYKLNSEEIASFTSSGFYMPSFMNIKKMNIYGTIINYWASEYYQIGRQYYSLESRVKLKYFYILFLNRHSWQCLIYIHTHTHYLLFINILGFLTLYGIEIYRYSDNNQNYYSYLRNFSYLFG